MKPKLLIVELWGLGDLVIGSPFLRAAVEKYDVTLLAKPYATELQRRLWPDVRVIPVIAPWTAFKGKYQLWRWPVWTLARLIWRLRRERFAVGVSSRWDPRDHLLLALVGAKDRLGYPRLGSQFFLNKRLRRPGPLCHRYEFWRVLGDRLGFSLPPLGAIPITQARVNRTVLVHTGAGQSVRVWPLTRFQKIIQRLRAEQFRVLLACDPDQYDAWMQADEKGVVAPGSVSGLLALIEQAGMFIGNDSGPGHLAAFCGLPTFSIFGPQLPEWFAPLHPEGESVEGKPCPYKPCSDYCRFAEPVCLTQLTEEEIWARLQQFLARHASAAAAR